MIKRLYIPSCLCIALIPPVVGISRLTKNEGSLVLERLTDNNLDELRGTSDPIWLDPDGNTIEGSQGRLSIPSITRNQTGDYLCQIRSIRNETLSTILTII